MNVVCYLLVLLLGQNVWGSGRQIHLNHDSSEERPKSFFFVRHGDAGWTQDDIQKGPTDSLLTNQGIKQAKQTATFLKDNWNDQEWQFPIYGEFGNILPRLSERPCIQELYSSPFLQAYQTAIVIGKKLNIRPTLLDDLQERYYGDYRLIADSSITVPPDAESDDDFQLRARSVFNELQKKAETDHFVVVSHQKVFEAWATQFGYKGVKINHAEIYFFFYDPKVLETPTPSNIPPCAWSILKI